jgi:hypothetical protein
VTIDAPPSPDVDNDVYSSAVSAAHARTRVPWLIFINAESFPWFYFRAMGSSQLWATRLRTSAPPETTQRLVEPARQLFPICSGGSSFIRPSGILIRGSVSPPFFTQLLSLSSRVCMPKPDVLRLEGILIFPRDGIGRDPTCSRCIPTRPQQLLETIARARTIVTALTMGETHPLAWAQPL